MAKIVKAVDDRGNVFRVTEAEAKARKLTIVTEANEAQNKKRTVKSK